MKILFYRYHSICEPDIIDALNELGVEVQQLVHTTNQNTDRSCCPDFDAQVRIISEYLSIHFVDAVFSVNFFPPIVK